MKKGQQPIKGKLIIVEGVDGSGKSTQIRLLEKWLRYMGMPVFFTEWNSSETVKESTNVVLFGINNVLAGRSSFRQV